jgi:thiazole/oxazole-forming peptide maturase SagD family component
VPVGRGLSRPQAIAGCLGEAAELLSSCVWGDEVFIRDSFEAVRKHAIHPDSLIQFSRQQYSNRLSWNAQHGSCNWIPRPFDNRRPIDWVRATAIDDAGEILVPACLVYIGYNKIGDEDAFGIAESSGCAAGATRERAVVAGFLELVERDAVALWWHGGHVRPAIDVSHLSEGSELVEWLGHRPRRYHLLDITTDLKIPAFVAISASDDGHDVALGTAAHFDPTRAAFSSITEMLQTELSLQLQNRCSASERDRGVDDWTAAVSFTDIRHLEPASVPLTSIPPMTSGPLSPAEELKLCLRACRQADLEMFVVNLTRPAIGMPAVRVIVPGLRPAQPRFADGRLYDVPVELGWCASPLKETDLNKVPLSI